LRYCTTIGDVEYLVEIVDEGRVLVNDKPVDVDIASIGDQPVYSMIVDGKSHEAYVYPMDDNWQVLLYGRLYAANVIDEREKRLRAASGENVGERAEFQLKAPMPGLLVAVSVADGQEVEKGDVLVILESMKMQNELKSPRAGTVSRVRVEPGDSVEQNQTLLSVI